MGASTHLFFPLPPPFFSLYFIYFMYFSPLHATVKQTLHTHILHMCHWTVSQYVSIRHMSVFV